MKLILQSILSLMICAAAPPAPRLRSIDIRHIALDLRFHIEKQQAHGTASIRLSPLAETTVVSLDAGMLTIHSIRLNNGKLLDYRYDGKSGNDGLRIQLDRSYKSSEELTLNIAYHSNWVNRSDPANTSGSFGKGLRFFSPTATNPNKRRQIWSMGEPFGNRYWFPGYDSPDDLRTTEIRATVETGLTALSNGILASTKDNLDGTSTFHWKMETPYPNHLTSIVVGQYESVEQSFGDVAIHSYGYPDERDAIRATVERLPGMLKYFSEKTGMNYPWPRYSQVVVQDFGGGVGHSMIPTITDNMIDDFGVHADFFYLWDLQEANSLASQWFGSILSISDWGHVWLNNSFTQYFSALFNEYKNGKEEFLLYQLQPAHDTYLADWKSGIRHPIVTSSYDSVDSFISDNYSSLRGSLVLHMLRKELGEDTWWKVIREYVSANAFQQVNTTHFQKAVEAAAHRPMRWFFDQWLYQMGHPVFKVSDRYHAGEQTLELIVDQTQQSGFFAGSVEVVMDNRLERVWLEAKARNSYKFKVGQRPKSVTFDHEHTWIRELVYEKSDQDLLYAFENSSDILDRTLAARELLTRPNVRPALEAAFRRTINGNTYWRHRFNTILQLRGLYAPQPGKAPLVLDTAITDLLQRVIQREGSWLRTAAIAFLGLTKDPRFAPIYIAALKDPSDRVVNAAAVALGKSGVAEAFSILVQLKQRPSWKSQSLISSLNGLRELGNPAGAQIAADALANLTLPRWWLATPVWDYRIAAADTLVALGKADEAYPMIYGRLESAIAGNDTNDIFTNLALIATLGTPRGSHAFTILKKKYKEDAEALTAVAQQEAVFNDSLKKRTIP